MLYCQISSYRPSSLSLYFSDMCFNYFQSYLLVCKIHSKCNVFKEQVSMMFAVWWLLWVPWLVSPDAPS